MEKMKLGAQLYTLREYCRTPKMFEKTMTKVKEMGFSYIQFSGVTDEISYADLKESADRHGLKVRLTHADDARIIGDTERVIEEHEALGCDGIGIGGMPGDMRNYDGYMRFIEKYSPAIEKIRRAGKTFCYHNHWFEFEHYENGKTGMQMLLENTDPAGFKLTLDTAWMHRGGVDVAQFIDLHPDRVFALHLKDMTIVNNEVDLTEMLDGNMNFDTIIASAQRAGIQWSFLEQDWIHNKNAFDSIKMSFDRVKDKYGKYFE